MNTNELEVLLVEDSPEDAALTLRALKKNNLINRIHVATDGAEALDYIFGNDNSPCLCVPRVIFLDLHLPKINGLEVLRKLKGDERTRRIPVTVQVP